MYAAQAPVVEYISLAPAVYAAPALVAPAPGFAYQVTADADAEVETFNAYVGWCKDQVQDDGHQQYTLHLHPSWSTSRRLQLYLYAAPAQVVEYLAPAPLAYAAPVAAETVGFGSFPVEPIILDDDSCCFLRTTRSNSNDWR